MYQLMQNRKIYPLTALFSPEDQEQFTLFLDSPYFNGSRTLSQFWKQWQAKVINTEGGADLSIADFLKGTNLKSSRFDKMCSQLYVKAKEFLAQQGYEKHSVLQEVFLAQAALARDDALETSLGLAKKVAGGLKKLPESPEKYLAQVFHSLNLIEARILARQPAKDFQLEFSRLLNLLTQFSESKRLQLTCAALNIGYIMQQKDSPFLLALESEFQAADHEPDSLLARIYFWIRSLQMDKNASEVFAKLLHTMDVDREKINPALVKEIYYFILNHCIRKINQIKEEDNIFLDHTVDLYAQLVENRLILVNDKLPPQQFKNIVTLACRAGRMTWVEGFIKQYAPILVDDHEGMAQTHNTAVLLFHQARYPEAIQLLKEVIRTTRYDVFYGLDARAYLWKAYYEHLDELTATEIDEMYRLYDSFRLYVDRNTKISELHKLQYRNLIRLFKRFLFVILDQPEEKKSADLKALLAELLSTKELYNKAWFARKVEEAIAACSP